MHHPIQPLVTDPKGVVRFKENAIVRHLLDWASARGMSMNDLALLPFSDEDQQQFAQLIGYSLSGYADLSYVSDEAYAAAELCSAAPVDQNQLEVRNQALRDELERARKTVNDAIETLQNIRQGST